MGSCLNFDNMGNMAQPEGGSVGRPGGNFPLARQSSIYSMTFGELQTFGSLGKDFGSMNMEDLLKNIWTAEETQVNNTTVGGNGTAQGGNLQRQGSLTLPRTLSQRTVDEVWKDLLKDNAGVKDGSGGGASNFVPRDPTLGEMTLEQFLVRAGVVREDAQPTGKTSNGVFYGGLVQPNGNNNGVTIGFQQPARDQGILGNQMGKNDNAFSNPSNLLQNGNGVRSSQQQQHHQQPQPQPQLQPLFPKQATVAFASPFRLGNNVQQIGNNAQLASPGVKASVVGMPNVSVNSAVAQGGVTPTGVMGIAGLRGVTTTVAGGSPGNQLHSDVLSKSSLDSSSLSPSPYAFNEGGRGRRSSSSLEKQVERRRKRMIKNRESAARSRARKQAYTLELEAEVAKLKEINQELQRKQVELTEMQQNQMLETMKMPCGGKRRCLRRTLTGPW
ncbi:hypothetical protein ACH5RR_022184 [Cinchona calisaya]|uniref:BZIP domain-containing protein n=1 Tax=Cinchona calisaya TaxID=153742 RepID=A0ABD2ZB02_9GENT